MKTIVFSVIVLLGISSCKKDVSEEMLVKNDPRLASSLRKSKESLITAGNNLVLTTYMWRDFMPVVGSDGRRLVGVVHLQDAQGSALSPSISLKRLFVIKGNEIWTTGFSEMSSVDATKLEGVVLNGPFWGPNINVDVVCEFVVDGKVYHIMAKDQPIHRTD